MKKSLFGHFVFLLTPALLAAQTVTVVQTNPDKSALLAAQPPLSFGRQSQQSLNIVINDALQYQTMDGFGASFTDSSAWLVWNKLTPAQRNELMRTLFTPAGANLSFLRQPMGASDLALSNYTYDDLPVGQTDPEMRHFSIAHDKAYIIPVLQQALALNPKTTVMALPWSPPAWMKAGQSLDGGSFDEQYFRAYAKYFSNFIHEYAANGIPITRIAAQNEPLNNNTGYPTLLLTDSQEAHFIAGHLGPTIEEWNERTNKPVEILGYEHNWDVQWYPEWLLRHPDAARYIAGTSFHCYGGDPTTAYAVMQEFFPEKGLWFTECSGTVGSQFGGDLGWNTDHLTIGSVRGGAKSVVLWNMALDQNSGPVNGKGCQNCRGVVTIDTSTTPATVSFNVEYYVLAQAAKFVVPGARRIDSNSFGSGSIEDVAFKNPDGSIVALVYNSASTPGAFSIAWNNQNFSYTLPAGAVATFKWNAAPSGIGANPPAQTVAQGGITEFNIDIDGSRWDGDMRLHVSGLPAAVDADFIQLPQTDHRTLVIRTSSGTPTGSYTLAVTADGDDGGRRETTTVQLTVGTPGKPFSGTPATLPGIIQAENFDNGDKGIAFNNLDLFAHPDGAPYRPGVDVSIEPTSDTGAGWDVNYIGAGAWLDYTANVTQAGLYSIQSRLASLYGGTYYHVEVDGRNATGQLYFPNTGWWQNWTTAGSPTFLLTAGAHVFRYVFDSNNGNGGVGNFNWFALAHADLGASQPYGGTPSAVPGVIQVENFDLGGRNVAYYTNNSSKATVYRSSDTVSIEPTSDIGGGYDVGNTAPGDWLNYTVTIAATRTYTLHVRVATQVPGGTFHLACDGKQVTPSTTVPQTGGWQTFQTIDIPDVTLPAGQHVLQLVMENPGTYSAIANFNWFSLD